MGFSDYVAFGVAFLSWVLAMYLGDNQWAHQHQWLLPVLWAGAGLSFMFAVFRTPWFRARFISEKSVSERTIVQSTRGNSNSPIAFGSGASVGTINVNAPAGAPPLPTIRRFRKVLEAVVQSPLYVEQSGYVIAQISIPGSLGLQRVIDNGRYADLGWGTLERQDCEIPFCQIENYLYEPATLEFRLVSADFAEREPELTDLEMDRDSQAIKFFVKPTVAGIHKAEVELLVHHKQHGSVPIHAEAIPSEITSGSKERIETITVTYMVHSKEYTKDREHMQEKDQSYEHRYEKDFGIDLSP